MLFRKRKQREREELEEEQYGSRFKRVVRVNANEAPDPLQVRKAFIKRMMAELKNDPLYREAVQLLKSTQSRATQLQKRYIHSDQEMRAGKAVIKGSRLTVCDILCGHVDDHQTESELLLACFVAFVLDPHVLS